MKLDTLLERLIRRHVDLDGLNPLQQATVIAVYQTAAYRIVNSGTDRGAANAFGPDGKIAVSAWSIEDRLPRSRVTKNRADGWSRIRSVERVARYRFWIADPAYAKQVRVRIPPALMEEWTPYLDRERETRVAFQAWREGFCKRECRTVKVTSAARTETGVLVTVSIVVESEAAAEVAVDDLMERYGRGPS